MPNPVAGRIGPFVYVVMVGHVQAAGWRDSYGSGGIDCEEVEEEQGTRGRVSICSLRIYAATNTNNNKWIVSLSSMWPENFGPCAGQQHAAIHPVSFRQFNL